MTTAISGATGQVGRIIIALREYVAHHDRDEGRSGGPIGVLPRCWSDAEGVGLRNYEKEKLRDASHLKLAGAQAKSE
jgi:hypothetical protein